MCRDPMLWGFCWEVKARGIRKERRRDGFWPPRNSCGAVGGHPSDMPSEPGCTTGPWEVPGVRQPWPWLSPVYSPARQDPQPPLPIQHHGDGIFLPAALGFISFLIPAWTVPQELAAATCPFPVLLPSWDVCCWVSPGSKGRWRVPGEVAWTGYSLQTTDCCAFPVFHPSLPQLFFCS